MPLKQLTQQQFNTTDGTVYSINIDMEDMDTVDLVNYLELHKNSFLFQLLLHLFLPDLKVLMPYLKEYLNAGQS